MNIAIGIAFLCLAAIFIVLSLLALLNIGIARLESSVGIARDGILPGKLAPRWAIQDAGGVLRTSPNISRWQFLIFADNCLESFPNLVKGMNHFVIANQNVEVLVLSRNNQALCRITKDVLELNVPIIPVEQSLYNRYHVRVMPFTFLLDPKGTIHQIGLVNTAEQLFKMWHAVEATKHKRDELEGVMV